MKKTLVLLSTIAMALTLSACSDATANISDGNETLISVGSEKVTKEDDATIEEIKKLQE